MAKEKIANKNSTESVVNQLLFCKFEVTTNHVKSAFTFTAIFLLYIYAAGSTPVKGHDSWLSHACTSGFFISSHYKDNHK